MGVPLLSVCIIARDEELSIGRCLQSIQGIADEIIVIDTGSTDKTAAISRSFGALVWRKAWNESFAEARNEGISKAKGAWILWLDADEILEQPVGESLRDELLQTEADIAAFRIVNFTGSDIDSPGPVYVCPQVRLFRNGYGFRFSGKIHETLVHHDGTRLQASPALFPHKILHYGYLEDVVNKKRKSERNLRLLKQQLASGQSDPWWNYHLASEYNRLGRYEEAFEQINRSIVGFLNQSQLPPALLYKLKYDILMAHGSLDGIWPGIEQAIRLYPDYVDLQFYKALYLLEKDLLLEAYDLLNRCIELGDTSWKYLTLKGLEDSYAYYYMAVCLLRLGRYKEGSELMRRTVGNGLGLPEAFAKVISS